MLYHTDMQYLEIYGGFSYLLGVIECEKTAVSSFNSRLFYRNFHEKNSHAFSSIPFLPLSFRKHLRKNINLVSFFFFFFSPTVQNALKGTNVVGK